MKSKDYRRKVMSLMITMAMVFSIILPYHAVFATEGEETGQLIINLVDSSDGNEKDEDGNYPSLAEGEFDLLDNEGEEVNSGTTDENGQIVFGGLPFGKYKLVQTGIAEDYVTPYLDNAQEAALLM